MEPQETTAAAGGKTTEEILADPDLHAECLALMEEVIATANALGHPIEGELSGILNWVEQLGEVNTDGVEPMTRIIPMTLKMRRDEVTDGDKADDIVRNAPVTEDHFFVVPKVIE